MYTGERGGAGKSCCAFRAATAILKTTSGQIGQISQIGGFRPGSTPGIKQRVREPSRAQKEGTKHFDFL